MITDHYRDLNAQLHRERKDYGCYGHQCMPMVMVKCHELQTSHVLDYGCGKATLNQHMPFHIDSYDPAIPKYAMDPEPADIVVCYDVMEHVEPDMVDSVLAHIATLTKQVALFQIDCREAKKQLPDGRNAHVSLHPPAWWKDRLDQHFEVLAAVPVNEQDHLLWAECRPKEVH